MKVAIYSRVSTDEQAGEDRFGLKSQLADIRRLCRQKNYEIVREYQDQASGATADRPGFQAMIDEAKRGVFQAIVVAKLDRLARSLMLQLITTDELSKAGVQVISVAEPSGNGDPETDKLMKSIEGAFAEFERARINSRMTAGRKQKAKIGGYSGGSAPWGYVVKDHKLVVDQNQAQLVKEVFRLREEHWSYQEIADWLNERTPTRRKKVWRAMAVWRIVHNKSMYRGRYRYAKCETKGQHQAIL